MSVEEGIFTAVAGFVVLVFAVAIAAVILALPVMVLWNLVMPDITHGAVTTLTFWQALGLNLLCGFLFRSYTSSTSGSSK